mgnify:CR=1 FL=1
MDLGYRGRAVDGVRVLHPGKPKRVCKAEKRLLKRRQAVDRFFPALVMGSRQGLARSDPHRWTSGDAFSGRLIEMLRGDYFAARCIALNQPQSSVTINSQPTVAI